MSGGVTRGPTYGELILSTFRRFGDRPAFVHGGQVASYREMHGRLMRFAAALQARGIGPGDAVTVLGTNTPDVLAAAAAGIVVGAHYVPLNPFAGPAENARLLERAAVSVLLFEPGLFDEHIAGFAAGAKIKEVLGIGPSGVAEDLHDVAARSAGFHPPQVDESDLAIVLHTGGTTGPPKGVMLSHRAMADAALLVAAHWQWPLDLRLAAIPQLAQGLLVPVALRGGTVVLVPGTDPEDLLRSVSDHRATVTYFPAAMLYGLLDAAGGRPEGTESLETVLYGATPIPPARIEEALGVFGPVFMQAYSLAEANVVTILRKEEHDPARRDRLGSCGQPVPGVDLTIQDGTGREVEPGEQGEICVRGRVVMDGYLDDPSRTEEALRDGWLHTGDYAQQDGDGFVHILGRRADMLALAAGSVPARAVEDVLAAYPGVMAAAVFTARAAGGDDDLVAAVARRAAGDVAPDVLTGWALTRLPADHVPRRVHVVDALPLTPNGKVDKRALREVLGYPPEALTTPGR